MAKQTFKLVFSDSAAADDPEAHGAVDRLVRGVKGENRHKDLKLKDRPGAAEVLKKDPAWTVRLLRALADQDVHYADERKRLFELEPTAYDFSDKRAIQLGIIRNVIATAATQLLRRKLPLEPDDFIALLAWPRRADAYHLRGVQDATCRQLEKMSKDTPLTPAIIDELEAVVTTILGSDYIDNRERAAPYVMLVTQSKQEQPSKNASPDSGAGAGPSVASSAAEPAPAGSPRVMWSLKKAARLLTKDAEGLEPEIIGLDEFPLPEAHPLSAEHAILDPLIHDFAAASRAYTTGWSELCDGPQNKRQSGWEKLLDSRDQVWEAALAPVMAAYEEDEDPLYLAACERMGNALLWTTDYTSIRHDADEALKAIRLQREDVTSFTGQRDLDFDRLLFCATVGAGEHWAPEDERLLSLLEGYAAKQPLTDGERYIVHWLRSRALEVPPMGVVPEPAMRLSRLIDGEAILLLVPEDRWTYRAHADLAELDSAQRGAWTALLAHALTARSSKPSAKWTKQAGTLLNAVSADAFCGLVVGWMAEVARGRAFPETTENNLLPAGCLMAMNDGNADVLRGLTWILAASPNVSAPRAVADLLATCIRKTPGVGPRAVKVANACIWALGEMATHPDREVVESAVGQLARLKAKVTFKTTLKAIEKAFDKAAQAAGMSKADLEELGVPSFGFEGGVRREAMGEASVELRVVGAKIVTEWTNEKGKLVKSPPAMVKRDYKDELKEIKAAAKDAEGILSAGRARLDGLYLADGCWALKDWRERWLDHGLLGTLAQRLVWTLDGVGATFTESTAVGLDGQPLGHGSTAEVRLWHPLDAANTAEVLAWRARLEELEIVQPFKQAHREVYVLTDAERATNTYSNRFAAHVVRQHQFNALAKVRGWNKTLQLAVDMEDEPATRSLPGFNLQAEFWISTFGEHEFETTDSGAYQHLGTDQVRFYNLDEASGGSPVPLADIPARVLSEVLRDCDLLVGVSSLGNDPTWQDGGPDGRHRDYWNTYSFGDLGATAQTRRAVLEKLLPRLKIRDVAEVEDKWLRVAGTKQTYKIHLGSGNILMEPGDRYLCIVADSKSAKKQPSGELMLPFEGDRMLSMILSKALLLASDDKIKDETILSQMD